ncbi:MAG: response regulator transcription factor [Burkholderiales bacterium]
MAANPAPAMKILIVDDHPMIAEYLRGAAAKAFAGAEIQAAGDLAGALAAARGCAFDLVLLDLALPGFGGIESLLRFRKAHPQMRVAVVSADEDPATVRSAFAAGAAGYISKSTKPKVVMSAMRLIADGGEYFPPEAMTGPEPRTPESRLTAREREVLGLLLKGRTIGEVANELGIAAATAKQHAIAVYAAYDVSSRADLILTARHSAAA